jgi:hypothetical protein
MGNIIDFLFDIEKTPELYIGVCDRSVAFQRIQLMIQGYQAAIENHGIKSDIDNFIAEFGDHLARRHGWSTSCGPLSAVSRNSRSPEEAWVTLWRELREYASANGYVSDGDLRRRS